MSKLAFPTSKASNPIENEILDLLKHYKVQIPNDPHLYQKAYYNSGSNLAPTSYYSQDPYVLLEELVSRLSHIAHKHGEERETKGFDEGYNMGYGDGVVDGEATMEAEAATATAS